MIIINMILKVPGKFDNKTQIKKHLYDNDDVLHSELKDFNNKLIKKYGDEYFSMTFVKPNIVVVTQRYIFKNDYEITVKMRDDLKKYMINNGIVKEFLISEPFEVNYDWRRVFKNT